MYKFDDIPHDDVSHFVSEFGYGDCHMLSQYLSEQYSFDIGIIKSHPSGIPIHSFVYINDVYALDAHGIDLIENTIERYRGFCDEYEEVDIRTDRVPRDAAIDELGVWCPMSSGDHQMVDEEFKHIAAITNIIAKIQEAIHGPPKITPSLKPKKFTP